MLHTDEFLVQSFETALEIGDDGQVNAYGRLTEMEPLALCVPFMPMFSIELSS